MMSLTRQSLNLNLKNKEEHESNILDMAEVDAYMSPGKNKDASTVNNLAYHILDE